MAGGVMPFRVSHWMTVLFVILSGVNIALFIFWLSLIKIDVIPDGRGQWDYVLNSISVQITILEAAVVIITLLLAVLGIIGYNQLKDHAEDKAAEVADDKATEVVNDQIDMLIQHIEVIVLEEVKEQLGQQKNQEGKDSELKGAEKLGGNENGE